MKGNKKIDVYTDLLICAWLFEDATNVFMGILISN